MKKEISVAVNLWADRITGKYEQDNGDIMQSSMVSLLRNSTKKPTEVEVNTFKSDLIHILTEACIKKGWTYDNPNIYASQQLLGVDYDPCEMLYIACKSSGISTNLLPIKSVMWIRPMEVSYKFGYSAQIETITISRTPRKVIALMTRLHQSLTN